MFCKKKSVFFAGTSVPANIQDIIIKKLQPFLQLKCDVLRAVF